MKRPYNEEKTGLRIELKTVRIILFAFFLSQEVFPQVPINGFCKYQSFVVTPDFNSLFTLNYNDDSYTDLILFNPDLKKIVSLSGQKNGNFDKPRTFNIPYQITNIQNLVERNKKIKKYAFTSRASRRAGIYSFTGSGTAILTGSIKFNSYPENISTADANQNGKDELLISGSAFNGLSIISQTPYGLKEKKIVEKTSFSEAVFADLRNDGFSDIAAFNLINNSLFFFYNNGEGNFSMVRTIPINEPIHSLKAVDLNLDNYTDLIFAKANSITVMYGDFASAYDKTINIPTKYSPDQIITGDFNRDGKIDIAYIDYSKNTLSVLFAKDEYSFYPEMVYIQKENLKNLVPYYSKFINGIAALSSDGKIYTLTNLASISSDVNIALSVKPTAISFFDHSNNGISDICYVDQFSKSLDLIVRNNAGIPSFYFSYPLFETHKKIVVENLEPKVKTFYCFTPGRKLIEILKVDFVNNKFERNSLYSPGKILDLKIKAVPGQKDNIYIAYSKNGNLGFSVVEFHDYRYTFTNYGNIASNILDANISLDKSLELIYWYKNNNGLVLSKTSFIGGVESNVTKSVLSLDNVNDVISFTGDLLNNENNASLSFVQTSKSVTAVLYNDNSPEVVRTKVLPDYFKISKQSQLFFGPIRINGLKKLCAYLPEKEMIAKIDFINKGRDFIISKIYNASNIESYFIKNMSFHSYNLVYIDKNTNCINIQQF